jgi:hypothetical protein
VTMREKLIEACRDTADVGEYGIVDNWPEVIDAILDVLREPDAAMQDEAFEACDGFVHRIDIPKSWQAMIDHIRSGK